MDAFSLRASRLCGSFFKIFSAKPENSTNALLTHINQLGKFPFPKHDRSELFIYCAIAF
ncbi:MAG: hypothetical protein IGS49_03790 [Chlorogloeopsis fritschii C42_A2020_084]|uniref:hypothetical protein n=1 Tax=Chlorogloeopsis fritschii TaxID=1124 RepID=UPI0019D9E627|nr:hypothetical protein [Chlorogloeopsis fritschii]MBF2004596.1 hypothetical protein [Chlorogloeopsis fritschii C42_A2020_084]